MKTIKFRAWDIENREMIRVDEINFGMEIVGTYIGTDERGDPGFGYLDFKQVILMQSTGLKDKNGVEIYEGDILEVEKNEDGTYKGTINGKTFFDRFQGYSSKIKVEGMHDIDTLRYWNNRVRIIGNIYEDPELL